MRQKVYKLKGPKQTNSVISWLLIILQSVVLCAFLSAFVWITRHQLPELQFGVIVFLGALNVLRSALNFFPYFTCVVDDVGVREIDRRKNVGVSLKWAEVKDWGVYIDEAGKSWTFFSGASHKKILSLYDSTQYSIRSWEEALWHHLSQSQVRTRHRWPIIITPHNPEHFTIVSKYISAEPRYIAMPKTESNSHI